MTGKLTKPWIKVLADGAAPQGANGPTACGILVLDENNNEITRYGKCLGLGSCNSAEYGAAIEAVKWLLDNGYKDKKAKVYMDSRLVVLQYCSRWKTKNPRLKKLKAELKELAANFTIPLELRWINRLKNAIPDEEAAKALAKEGLVADWYGEDDV